MKRTVTVLIIAAGIVSIFFSSFGRNTELSDLDSVCGVTIDKEKEKWLITCEITLPSKDDPYGSKNKYVKAEALTLKKAFDNAQNKSDKELNMSSVGIFIIANELKDNAELINYFMRDEVNMRAVCVYCEGKAEKFFEEKDAGAGSIFLAQRIKRFCFNEKTPVPKVSALLKNRSGVILTKNGIPERSGTFD